MLNRNRASRVNLSVEMKTEEGSKTIQLPHKILVMGNFSGSTQDSPLLKRKRYRITEANQHEVMSSLQPKISISLNRHLKPDVAPFHLALSFNALEDFHPDSLIKQVPELAQLLAMRHLLKELRSQLIDSHDFKQKIQALLLEHEQKEQMVHELTKMYTTGVK